MCLYPKLIDNPKYKATKKNGGNIPPVLDDRVKKVPIGCGKCIECLRQKSREWLSRITEDIKQHKNGKFVTLTFNTESIRELTEIIRSKDNQTKGYDLDNEIATLAVRRFLERWRKEYKKSVRHWLVTELGHSGTEHLHLHGIIWTDEPLDKVEKHWKYGWVWKGKKYEDGTIENYVNATTAAYITKYMFKADKDHPNYKAIVLCSAGIGRYYTQQKYGNHNLNKYTQGKTDEAYRLQDGRKVGLAIYWRNKIYTEEQREKLWLEKLDKQERYVMGVKFDISKTEQHYENALREAQEKNKRLGYGGNPNNWEQEQYERDRRILKQMERLKKKNNNSHKKK